MSRVVAVMLLGLGDPVAVLRACGTLGRAAVVRWLSGGLMGLCFDSELDPRDVSALIDRSTALTAWRKTRE